MKECLRLQLNNSMQSKEVASRYLLHVPPWVVSVFFLFHCSFVSSSDGRQQSPSWKSDAPLCLLFLCAAPILQNPKSALLASPISSCEVHFPHEVQLRNLGTTNSRQRYGHPNSPQAD